MEAVNFCVDDNFFFVLHSPFFSSFQCQLSSLRQYCILNEWSKSTNGFMYSFAN